MKTRVAPFLVLLAASPALATPDPATPQSPLTLDEAISEAKTLSPRLRQARASEDEAGWKKLEAASGHIPKLSVSFNHSFSAEYQTLSVPFGGGPPFAFPEIFPETIIEFDASWTVFDGLKTIYGYQAANLSHEASVHELTRAEFQLEESIRLSYYQALAAQALENVAEQNVKTLEDHLANTKDVLRAGQATRFDLLRVQVQLDEAVPEMQAAKDDVVLARRALAQSIGNDEFERPISGELPIPTDRTLPADSKSAIERDDVIALRKRAEAERDTHASAVGSWLPQVNLFGQKQYYHDSQFALSTGLSDAYTVGISATWNLFDGGATLARLGEGAARAESAEAAADALVLSAPNELETWKRRYQSNLALYQARKRAVEAAQESVRLAKLGFQAGTRTNTDVLDAELDLFRARAGVVRAQLDAATAMINIELSSGSGKTNS